MVKCLRKLHLQTPSSLAWLWLDTLKVPPCQTAAGCRAGCHAPAASFVLLLWSPDPARMKKVKKRRFVGAVLRWFSSLKHGASGAREHDTRKRRKRGEAEPQL